MTRDAMLEDVPERSSLGMARATLWWHIKDVCRDVWTAEWLEMPVLPFFANGLFVLLFPLSFPFAAWVRRRHCIMECRHLEQHRKQKGEP